MTELIDHPISAIFGGKVVHWAYKGPRLMKEPHQREFWVPYHFPRQPYRYSRSPSYRDDHAYRSMKRHIMQWLKPDRVRKRHNRFAHNVQIRKNFEDSSYRNRWY